MQLRAEKVSDAFEAAHSANVQLRSMAGSLRSEVAKRLSKRKRGRWRATVSPGTHGTSYEEAAKPGSSSSGVTSGSLSSWISSAVNGVLRAFRR